GEGPLVVRDPVGLRHVEPAAVLGASLELRGGRDPRPAPAQRTRGAVLVAPRRELDDDRQLRLARREDVLVEVLAQAGRLAVERPGQRVEDGALAAAGGAGDGEEVAVQDGEVHLVLAAEAAEVPQPQPLRPHDASSSASTLAWSSSNLRITASSRRPPWPSRQNASKLSRRLRAAASLTTPSTGVRGTSTWMMRAFGRSRLTRSRTVGSCLSSFSTSF